MGLIGKLFGTRTEIASKAFLRKYFGIDLGGGRATYIAAEEALLEKQKQLAEYTKAIAEVQGTIEHFKKKVTELGSKVQRDKASTILQNKEKALEQLKVLLKQRRDELNQMQIQQEGNKLQSQMNESLSRTDALLESLGVDPASQVFEEASEAIELQGFRQDAELELALENSDAVLQQQIADSQSIDDLLEGI